jgi:hypothetical protein
VSVTVRFEPMCFKMRFLATVRLYGSRSARNKAKKNTACHGTIKHYYHQKHRP